MKIPVISIPELVQAIWTNFLVQYRWTKNELCVR